MKKIANFALSSLCVAMLAACSGDDGKDGTDGATGAAGTDGTNGVSTFVTEKDVVITNAQHAYAVYADSLIAAKQLKNILEQFVVNPTDENFTAAKNAWLDAREPYGQSEVYRFREGPIDNLTTDDNGDPVLVAEEGPEGAINAWPLAEALIDYTVDMDGAQLPENPATLPVAGNIIADIAEFPEITKDLLAAQFERGDDEANVTSGYHAIEFLLWGQDLNADGSYTPNRDYSAGYRKVNDYYTAASGMGECTSGVDNIVDSSICERRGDYLIAAADLLIDDLQGVVDAWTPGSGFHYVEFTKDDNVKMSLAKILEGMGRLSFGELAGERMSIALRTDSQEDEHSCFSDNTHRDIFLNAKGIQNAFTGAYQRMDGETLKGASIYDLLVVDGSHQLANELRAAIENTMAQAAVIDTNAKLGYSFDVQIQHADLKQPVTNTIEALKLQTQVIKKAIEALEVTTGDLEQDTEEFEG
ncbi:imelysin family protein [Pseudoalteromonas piratica]|uniref:Insulin-cleaving metalloproteinase outer membrane protein n=1 Tax=Pseudoalteromonas piratica TaxID=1348114 RepID=A0A0A7EFM1_9GAMM|nr:imelysin family protein [Pseudoalteromonas piratica]AIY64797.1 insulin-cleaving metalloproteinase outer membrane protein [Pseudoalteromonas piratica]